MNILIDFDSTIISNETLEFLFAEAGATGEQLSEIERITALGMNGEIGFSESLSRRLELLSLTESQLRKASEKLAGYLSESFLVTLPYLLQQNTYVISGGFQQVLETVLAPLGFEAEQLFGNRLLFDDGELIGYDTGSLLAQDNGKVALASSLQLAAPVVAIGDGATDLELLTQSIADHFIYYGEHVQRTHIMQQSPYMAKDFYEVEALLTRLSQ